MPAISPEQANQLLAEAINSGDLEAAVALYEADATLSPEPGQAVTGAAAIREVFGGFIAMKPTLNIETLASAIVGDTALTQDKWNLKATGSDGSPIDLGGQSTKVIRRQPDGSWKFVIDIPWSNG